MGDNKILNSINLLPTKITPNILEVRLRFLKIKIFYFILSSTLVFALGSASLAETKWSNSLKKGEWKEFIPKNGKANFDSNQIVGCGSPKKSFTILFGGTPELPKCQIGVKEPYRKTKRDIEFGEYDIHGTMRTKCAVNDFFLLSSKSPDSATEMLDAPKEANSGEFG